MDRKEIKDLAKTKIRGNIWNLLWPVLCIMVISGISSTFINGTNGDPTAGEYLVSLVISLLVSIISTGYLKYLLDFVRTGKMDANVIINTIKEKWINIIIAEILVGLIVGVGFLCLIIPGIILALGYTIVNYLIVDSDISGADALKKSREMMKGYKMDYFVFVLSFFGWFLLSGLTFGLLLIWVVPYYYVANTIFYEKLKEKNKK